MRLTRSIFGIAWMALVVALDGLTGMSSARAASAEQQKATLDALNVRLHQVTADAQSQKSPGPAAAPAKSDTGSSKTLLTPQMEVKLADFIAKTKVEKIKVWDDRMTKMIDNIAKVTGLGDDGKKALEAPAKQAVAIAIADWEAKSLDAMRKELVLMPPEQAAMVLGQQLSQAAAFAQADWLPGITLPSDEDEWTKGLRQTLSPDQLAAWNKAEDDRKQAIEKEMGGLLKSGVERIHLQQTQQVMSECSEIELAAGLSKERSAKLEDLGKGVVDQTSEMWRKRVEKMLLSMEDSQRQEFTSNGNIFIGTNDDESPLEQPAWKDGLAHFLTGDEMTRLKTTREARKAKRVHVMGQMLIVLLDERIAFTAAQRQRLEPIAQRLVADVPELYPPEGNDMQNNCSPGVFYATAGKANDAELKPILDDIQLKRWRHLADDPNPPEPKSDEGKTKPQENPEPEDIEKAISLFLYHKSENERKRMFDLNVLKAEDAARVAGMGAESSARLQAAARGATEESLTTWKWFTEQQVRSQLQEVTPENIQQRLDSLEDYMFFQRNFGRVNSGSIWDETVKSELTPQQQQAWKKETDARAAFRDDTIATLVVSQFEGENKITPDQSAKLEPMVASIVHDFSADIGQIFSGNNPVPWYMQGFYSLLPVAGISDADLANILTKDQIDRWHGSPECGNITGLWQNIEQMHKQRANMN